MLHDLAKEVKQISTKYYNLFFGRIFFRGGDGLQNMFVYQPTFNNINIKKNNEYSVFTWKSRGIYISELTPLHDPAPIIA